MRNDFKIELDRFFLVNNNQKTKMILGNEMYKSGFFINLTQEDFDLCAKLFTSLPDNLDAYLKYLRESSVPLYAEQFLFLHQYSEKRLEAQLFIEDDFTNYRIMLENFEPYKKINIVPLLFHRALHEMYVYVNLSNFSSLHKVKF